MAVSNRRSIINKLFRVIKKHYKPHKGTSLSVIDSLLFAACLEDAHYEVAEHAYDKLRQVSFDLNEIRVTAVGELAEHLSKLPYPRRAATNAKLILQSVFESQYSYDLEALRKHNLGQAVKTLEAYEGTSQFIIAYTAQNALGGHSIPIDRGSLECLYISGVVNETEREKRTTPGLERAVPKSKGFEFGSLVHQLGADLTSSPYGPKAKGILLEINPDAKQRLPKRITKKQREAAAKKKAEAEKAAAKAAAEAKRAAAQKAVDAKREAAKKKAEAKKSAARAKRPIVKKKATRVATHVAKKKKKKKTTTTAKTDRATKSKRPTKTTKATPKKKREKKPAAATKKKTTARKKVPKKVKTKRISRRKPK